MTEEPKKTKWVPQPNSRHLTKWHIHSYHKGALAQGLGGFVPSAIKQMHDQMHADGDFQEGQEHKHWEPKQ